MIGWPFVLAGLATVLLLRARRLQAWRVEVFNHFHHGCRIVAG